MKTIDLTRGKKAIVDDQDYEYLAQYKWHLSDNDGYAARTNYPHGSIYMHRELLGNPENMLVDHINRNRLDNRRANLRAVTPKQSSWNTGGTQSPTSPYKGVDWRAKKQQWRARIKVDGRARFLGYFDTAEDAARAYNRAAAEIRGEFAFLNDVVEDGAIWRRAIGHPSKRKSNKYVGVSWKKSHKKWRAIIGKDGKTYFLGYYDSPIDAALAYDKKARELYGEMAKTNFPLGG